MAIDSVRRAEVVTADGELITASATENVDLFWALRGGGGNFGVVTGWDFELHPARRIYGGSLFVPATADVIRGYLDYAVEAADELTTIATLMLAPPLPFIPRELHFRPVFEIDVCFAGDAVAGQPVVAPLRSLAPPIADIVGSMPYPEIYRLTDQSSQRAFAHVRSGLLRSVEDQTISSLIEAIRDANSPGQIVRFRPLGGAMARVRTDATAFVHRDARYMLTVNASYSTEPADDDGCLGWTADVWHLIRTEVAAAYVNFLGDADRDRLREAYPAPTFMRLAAIKLRYDPANLFCRNVNIRPARIGHGQE